MNPLPIFDNPNYKCSNKLENKIPILTADCPIKRVGQPYEIAPIFLYLASDDSSYTTGQIFHINGGEYKG